jgi:HPt (histidine-containing phosphotransfer) domain-containing protein
MAENFIPENLAVLNRENALTNFSDDAALVDEMLAYFGESAPDSISKLQSAIKDNRFSDWASAAHFIKGESATLCLERINCIVAKIEKAGKAQDNSEVETMFKVLEDEFAAFKKLSL